MHSKFVLIVLTASTLAGCSTPISVDDRIGTRKLVQPDDPVVFEIREVQRDSVKKTASKPAVAKKTVAPKAVAKPAVAKPAAVKPAAVKPAAVRPAALMPAAAEVQNPADIFR